MKFFILQNYKIDFVNIRKTLILNYNTIVLFFKIEIINSKSKILNNI